MTSSADNIVFDRRATKRPDLSVVIPVYNTGRYLEATLASVTASRVDNLEVILVNDGSTDDSLERCQRWCETAEVGVLLLSQPNTGVSAARNAGFREAKGLYLACVDSDDRFDSAVYRTMLTAGFAHDADLVMCGAVCFDSMTNTPFPFPSHDVWDAVTGLKPLVVTNVQKEPRLIRLEVNANYRIMKRVFADKVTLEYPQGLRWEDVPIHVKSLLAADQVVLIRDTGYFYRVGRAGQITGARGKIRADIFPICDMALREAINAKPSVEAGANVAGLLARLLYWCGQMSYRSDRRAFFAKAFGFYQTIPPAWRSRISRKLRHRRSRTPDRVGSSRQSSHVHRYDGRSSQGSVADRDILCIETGPHHAAAHPGDTPAQAHAAMIVRPHIDRARKLVATHAEDKMLEEDLWRVRSGFFGIIQRPERAGGVMLLIGARSGLEALLALLSDPTTKVFVVDSQASARTRLIDVTSGRAAVFGSLSEALDAGLPADLDYVRVDVAHFDATLFHWLSRDFRLGYFCGEFSMRDLNPLHVYRTCRLFCGETYFHVAEHTHAMSTVGGTPSVEVSVVVPAYNVEHYLPQCLQSLVDQTIESFEVIVVDDGSPDGSGGVADEWAARHPTRIRVIHKANGGCASARMAGLRAARGEFVGFVDGDDWCELQMFERLYEAAVLRSSEIAQCGFYEIYTDGTLDKHPTAHGGDGPGGVVGLILEPRRLAPMKPAIWRRIYRRDFVAKAQLEFPEHIRRFDDLPFEFLALEHASKMSVIPDCLYAYRQGRPGQDIEANDMRLFVHFDIFDWLFDRVSQAGDGPTLRKLLWVEINTHRWALGRIKKEFKQEYRRKAIRQYLRHGSDRALRSYSQLRHFIFI